MWFILIYRLHYTKLFNNFIELKSNTFDNIYLACMASEFQKIDRDPIEVVTSDEYGGMEFPDFYYDDAVPLFSESAYACMKKSGVDNLFLKEVTIIDALQDISKKYILALPPRICVLNEDGCVEESKIGNYQIFKISDIPDNNIYITDKLRNVFQRNKIIGMEILEADVLYSSK